LTNTDRYYSKEDVEKEGIRYMKLNCAGREGAPNEDQTNLFIRICKTFTEKNPNEHIGVHCTHGFNRSGFLICAFLVVEHDWGVDVALQQFAKMRPPGIYKQDYINRLFEMYADPDDPDMSPPTKPELPGWCFEDQDVQDDDGFSNNRLFPNNPSSTSTNNRNNNRRSYDEMNESPNGSRSSNGFKRGRKEFVKGNPTFMEGVPGVEPVSDRQEIERIQQKVQNMCDWHR
jgi:mRNA-capping enzyme